MLFELNYGYHPYVFFKEEINLHSISCFANELRTKRSNNDLLPKPISRLKT